MKAVLFAACFSLLLDYVTSINRTYEKKLRDKLFDPNHYDKTVRPVSDPNKPINISFSLQLSKLVELNTKKQLLVTDVWIVQKWFNPFLKWNETEHGGIHSLHIHPGNVWVPDTVLYNNGDDGTNQAGFLEKFKTYVILDSSGLCTWMAPTTFKSSCNMDITNFPFDSQTCEMTFGSWTFDNRLLRMVQMYDHHAKAEKFVFNGDWEIRRISIKNQLVKYTCCRHPFSDVTYIFVLDRKPSYHVMYLIAPCVIISCLSLLSFLLPPECGERVGLSITILLAMSVYLLIVSDIIPETSDYVPRLGMYYIAIMVLVASTSVATTITLRCHFNRVRPSLLLMKVLGCKNYVNPRVSGSVVVEDLTLQESKAADALKAKQKSVDDKGNSIDQKKNLDWQECWMDIAARLDKIFLLSFLIIFTVVNLGILVSRD